MRLKAALIVLLALPLAGASGQEVFSGQIASGAWLRLRTPHGDIKVDEASGNRVTVTARQHRGDDDDNARFDVQRDGNNVTICAILRGTQRCDAEGDDVRWGRGRDRTSVDYTVSLPKGVRLLASTGNGDVDIRNAGSDVRATSGNGELTVNGAGGSVDATTGNGDVRVERAGGQVDVHSGNGDITVTTARGPVSARSGNGRINVEMAALSGDDDMTFNTGNGSITVSFPANLSARIDANVSRNGFETDFPIQMPGGWNTERVSGTIGNGGRRIRFSTGNGRVAIRKN
jgi:hypothetical protein